MTLPFANSFVDHGPFGVLVGVHLPPGPEDPVESALEELHPEEREVALSSRGRRRIEWTGGRLALHRAAAEAGIELGAVLRGPRGEPLLPPDVSGSISHKRRLAVALIAPASDGTLGVDLEELAPERMSILGRVLRPEEEREVLALPEDRRWDELVTRFAIKEAAYKALHPHVNRYVGFTEATVGRDEGGRRRVFLHLGEGEGPFSLEARVDRREDFLAAQVRLTGA